MEGCIANSPSFTPALPHWWFHRRSSPAHSVRSCSAPYLSWAIQVSGTLDGIVTYAPFSQQTLVKVTNRLLRLSPHRQAENFSDLTTRVQQGEDCSLFLRVQFMAVCVHTTAYLSEPWLSQGASGGQARKVNAHLEYGLEGGNVTIFLNNSTHIHLNF